jgi:hypothetical protein
MLNANIKALFVLAVVSCVVGSAVGCSDAASSPAPAATTPTEDAGETPNVATVDPPQDTTTTEKDSGTDARSSAAPATISGTLGGQPLLAKDAIAFNKNSRLTLKITDYEGACALEENGNAHKQNSHYLELYLDAYPGTATAHTIGSPTQIGAQIFTRDGTCSGPVAIASGGTVTVTSVTTSDVVGTFNLAFPEGPVTGTFKAPICNAGALVGSGGPCVP